MDRRSPLLALLIAALCAAGSALTWLVAYHTHLGRQIDQAGFNGFRGLDRSLIAEHGPALVRLVDPGPFLLASLALVCVAIARGRPRLAALIAVVLGGANATTQVLKPRLGAALDPALVPVGFPASWPSGHTTAVMSLALCLVLVAPAWLRPAAGAVAGLGVVVLVYCIVALGYHLPSDIVGGFGVAATWAWLGVAALLEAERRRPERGGRSRPVDLRAALGPPIVAAGVAAGAATAVALLRPQAVLDYAQAHTTFVVGAGAIGVLGLALVAGLAVLLRR